MTLIEMVIVVGVLSMVMVATTAIFLALWRLQGFTTRMGVASQRATYAITRTADLLRAARRAENGAYPVERVAADAIVFYADVDGDGLADRIRIFRDGDTLRRGVTPPQGTDVIVYDAAREVVRDLVRNVVDAPDGSDIFQYYDGMNTLLSAPQPGDVRMVRMTVAVDDDVQRPPAPVVASTLVSLRNLRVW